MRSGAWPLLVAGTIARDDVRTPLGANAGGLGGSATYFALAARLFAPVHVIGAVGPDMRDALFRALGQDGIDVRGIVRSEKPTYHWIATHDYTTGTTSSERSEQGAYERFDPALLPEQRRTRIVFLGSMQPRFQARVLDQLESPMVVAGDTMRLYISEQRRELEPVLERLDYLILNGVEALALAQTETVEEAVRTLRRRFQLRGLVIKEGPRGATLFTDAWNHHVAALPVDPPVDPTGAGDAVAGGFLGHLAESQREDRPTLQRALAYAMVMASFTIQHFSIEGLVRLTRDDVEARLGTLAPA